MRRVFEGEAPEVDEKSLRYTIDKLREALYEGYGERAQNLQFGTPDEEMVSNLQNNIYQFSVAKNHQSLRDLQKALVNSDGKIASFTEFREAARKIDRRYNITYLRTEYDTAISSAQMAAHWARFGQGKTDPMLRYVTAGDERVRHSHAELNGLQRPMSDPIWNMIYPPNGWNCRCTVVEVNGKPTPPGELRLPGDVPPLFRTNLAKTGMLFPKGHPYFEGITSKELAKALLYTPVEDTYLTISTPSGHSIKVNFLHNNHELKQNVEIADILLNNGLFKDVRFLPDIYKDEKEVKKMFYPKGELPPNENKNADAILDGHVYEFKTTTAKNIGHNIIKASDQARRVVIRLLSLDNTSSYEIERVARMKKAQLKLHEITICLPDEEGNMILRV